MPDTTIPHFFDQFPMQRVTSESLDTALANTNSPPLSILFLWGRDCPNCDIAKREMLLTQARFAWPEVRWLHDNVYEDASMATRFGLHGIPAFFVFRGARRIGRISPWPGGDAFRQAIEAQIAKLAVE
jgi:hypothetical protein